MGSPQSRQTELYNFTTNGALMFKPQAGASGRAGLRRGSGPRALQSRCCAGARRRRRATRGTRPTASSSASSRPACSRCPPRRARRARGPRRRGGTRASATGARPARASRGGSQGERTAASSGAQKKKRMGVPPPRPDSRRAGDLPVIIAVVDTVVATSDHGGPEAVSSESLLGDIRLVDLSGRTKGMSCSPGSGRDLYIGS